MKSFDDEYCKDCWQLIPQLPESYLNRKECFEENCVIEEEFDMLTSIQKDKDIDTLGHLVRKYPDEAMGILNFNQMLEYIMSHNNITVNLEKAKVELVAKEV